MSFARPETEFQLRRDLEYSEYAIGQGTQTVIKDPLNLEFYFFDAFESGLLRILDSPKTISQLKDEFDQQIKPGFIGLQETGKFINHLLRDNLVTTNQIGSHKIPPQSERQFSLSSLTRISSLLALKFRGLNPTHVFDALTPLAKIFFHPVSLLSVFALYLVAIIFLILNFESVFQTGYIAERFSTPSVILPLGLAVVLVKVLHEFGHGLACHAMGRKCHELGVMLLAFMPCLYCNVSDMWMESNRWKRILVSFAGIYVELIIAAICVPLWLFSVPGDFQFFCFSLVLVCSINTLFVNGNPLLRYDGYFVLSDWLQIPNLADKAGKSLTNRFHSFFMKGGASAEPQQSTLLIYGVLAAVYRKFIFVAILLMIYNFLDNMRLPKIGLLVCGLFVSSAFLAMSIKMKNAAQNLVSGLHLIKWFRAVLTITLIGIGLFFVANIPVTSNAIGRGQLTFVNESLIYAPDTGQITWEVAEGDEVKTGDRLGIIFNEELNDRIRSAQFDLDVAKSKLEKQKILTNKGIENRFQINALELLVTQLTGDLESLEQKAKNLILVSKTSGILKSLPNETHVDLYQTEQLDGSVQSLDKQNRNPSVQRGEPVALVASSSAVRLDLLIPEEKIDRVKLGATTEIYLPQNSTSYISGKVVEMGIQKLDAKGEVISDLSNTELAQRFFRVTVAPDEQLNDFRYDARVDARVIGERITLFESCRRFLRDNIQF